MKKTLDGKTRLVAIFGWPLTYTLSPVFQNVALQKKGLNAVYVPLASDSPAKLKVLARSLMATANFIGANVTNPYKVEARRLAQSVSPSAKAIGAANTLVRQGQRWVAHNTDAPGFLVATKEAGARAKGARVLVLGAGGAARAIVWAVGQAGATEIAVLARRPQQAKDCAKVFKEKAFGNLLNFENVALASQAADWVVNTLPGAELGARLGQHLAPAAKGAWAMDINYLPRPLSPFLKSARGLGYKTLDGLPMLAEQGRLAFELWFGTKPTKTLTMNSLKRALRQV